jgi:hypothetical protein
METLDHVETSLNYLGLVQGKPVILYDPPNGTPAQSVQTVAKPTTIHNAREVLQDLSLDKQGFVLTPHQTAVSDFYDDNAVRSAYYPEVERLVKRLTGTSRVLVFDHNLRSGLTAGQRESGVREPVKIAHNDYTTNSGPRRFADLLNGESKALSNSRFAVINVWRPIRGPVQESPLAVCDARTISQADLVATDLKYRGRTGEIYVLLYNPRQRWFYFPKMDRNEALVFKCFDSDHSRPRFVAHSAFKDPASPPDAKPRESIEARALAIFAPESKL